MVVTAYHLHFLLCHSFIKHTDMKNITALWICFCFFFLLGWKLHQCGCSSHIFISKDFFDSLCGSFTLQVSAILSTSQSLTRRYFSHWPTLTTEPWPYKAAWPLRVTTSAMSSVIYSPIQSADTQGLHLYVQAHTYTLPLLLWQVGFWRARDRDSGLV